MRRVNQWEFEEIGHRCRVLLHDCYDFNIVFALKPDEFTVCTRPIVRITASKTRFDWSMYLFIDLTQETVSTGRSDALDDNVDCMLLLFFLQTVTANFRNALDLNTKTGNVRFMEAGSGQAHVRCGQCPARIVFDACHEYK
jgi:hypothetical protein